MDSNDPLSRICTFITSDKVKEREEGLKQLADGFTNSRFISTFHLETNEETGRRVSKQENWIELFFSVQTALRKEVIMFAKHIPPRPVDRRRLDEAARTYRLIVERAVKYINNSVLKLVVEDLSKTLRTSNAAFEVIGLDCMKALKCLLAYQPHIEHLSNSRWVSLLELSFNVVLDDPLDATFADEDGPADDAEENGMFVDDTHLMDVDEKKGEASVRKRRHDGHTIKRERSATPSLPHPYQITRPFNATQSEAASLILLLVSAPTAPLPTEQYPALPGAILNRLHRFLTTHPSETSLHHDFVRIMLATLDHVALNMKAATRMFATKVWEPLVSLWEMKEKRVREDLVALFRALFPYLVAPSLGDQGPDPDGYIPIVCLWKEMGKDLDRRWGSEALTLDALRLEFAEFKPDPPQEEPFVMKTFRAGLDFKPGHALSWAALELQADCTAQLYKHSESMLPIPGEHSTIRKRKRFEKLEHPVLSLLPSPQDQVKTNYRIHHLQVLLFFVERHWDIVHSALKEETWSRLFQLITDEDPVVQAWVFMVITAISCAEGSILLSGQKSKQKPSPLLDACVWDSVWAHAVRRASVTGVSRAACHAGHSVLLFLYPHTVSGIPLLSTNRVLLEIETLTKDIDVQGPASPFDSVCQFLSLCLSIASQDVRLYRMRLEDKVLSWLVDSWKLVGLSKIRLDGHGIKDIMLLLQTLCGSTKRLDLPAPSFLPDCGIVTCMLEEAKTRTIRDYVLFATLPPFQQRTPSSSPQRPTPQAIDPQCEAQESQPPDTQQLASPAGRERRLSSFFSRSLESLNADWKDMHRPTVERARVTLDFALTSLLFECSLMYKGVSPNAQVLQNATKLIRTIVTLLPGGTWSIEEKALVALALEPLVHHRGPPLDVDAFQEGFLLPDRWAGIRREVLQKIRGNEGQSNDRAVRFRMSFLRLLWQNPSVQPALKAVGDTLREVLSSILDPSSSRRGVRDDDFGPRVDQEGNRRALSYLLQACIRFLCCGSLLQKHSGEPARDKELCSLVLNTVDTQPSLVTTVFPAFCQEVRMKTLSLSTTQLSAAVAHLCHKLGMQVYDVEKSELYYAVIADLLDATMDTWISDSVRNETIATHAHLFMVSTMVTMQSIRSWKYLNRTIVFIHRYLEKDPHQSFWQDSRLQGGNRPEKMKSLPIAVLDLMVKSDIRVRFRAGLLNGKLFSLPTLEDSNELYAEIIRRLAQDSSLYERVLTRTLTLANLIVVSSAVRRGAYWHLLEVGLSTRTYTPHLESALSGAAQRLGMTLLSLFDSYSSQLAYSAAQVPFDFLSLPYHIPGYNAVETFHEAILRAFTPTNILFKRYDLLEHYCKKLGKEPLDAVKYRFGDIVGTYIVYALGEDQASELTFETIRKILAYIKGGEEFSKMMKTNITDVIIGILSTLRDHDYSEDSDLAHQVAAFDPSNKSLNVFRFITKYRGATFFQPHIHGLNLPAFPVVDVVRAIVWLSQAVPGWEADKAVTFHVMHYFFAELQRTPLANEQNRFTNALTLWMSLRHKDFEDAAMLRPLLQNTTLLFAQADLARAAQSILEWTLRAYRRTGIRDNRLSHSLTRMCRTAYEYASNTEDHIVAAMGADLVGWAIRQIQALAKATGFETVVLQVVAAWPTDPPDELSSIHNSISVSDLSPLISDRNPAPNKFRLVRRLQELALVKGRYDSQQWAEADFWRLKETIPIPEELKFDEAEAFASLLTLNHGRLSTFNIEQATLLAPGARHIRTFKKVNTGNDVSSAREAVLIGLAAILEGEDGLMAFEAYKTLRYLLSQDNIEEAMSAKSLAPVASELNFIKAYPCPLITRQHRCIIEELASPTFLEMSGDYPRWMKSVTILICDFLAHIDKTFAQITYILESDVQYAFSILPILVHTALQSSNQQGSVNIHTQEALSRYFSTVLSSPSTHPSTLKAIIRVCLHLRYFAPINKDSSKAGALAYNSWLDIDFLLLARCAVTCGAYTTALLFLELDPEYPARLNQFSFGTSREIEKEQLLYEIYAHIDEPDGFYGIKSSDLSQFLVKRFHHERQWDKAFRFHGAALEAGSARNVGIGGGGSGTGVAAGGNQGLLESFHFFGFNHLAIDSLQNSRVHLAPTPTSVSSHSLLSGGPTSGLGFGTSSLGDASMSSGGIVAAAASHTKDNKGAISMTYRLGWRTETWDLPDQSNEAVGAPLYHSLRAVYRERDTAALDATIRNAAFTEMERLRDTGPESYAETKSTAQDLMCLSEIVNWKRAYVERGLEAKNVDMAKWDDFVDIDEKFEFLDLEAIMATRVSLVRSTRQREERQQLGHQVSQFARDLIEIEKRCLLRLSKAARDENQGQIALNSVVRAQALQADVSSDVAEEYANVLWFQKEERSAVQVLQGLISNDKDKVDKALTAVRLARLGTWTAEAFLAKPSVIQEQYFRPAVDNLPFLHPSMESHATPPNARAHAEVYHAAAIFAERQYNTLNRSADGHRYRLYVDRKTQEVQHHKSNPGAKQHLANAQKLLKADSERYRRHTEERDMFLTIAIEMHSRVLEVTDLHDIESAIRFFSLWFSNFENLTILNSTVRAALERVKSRKAVFLAHQITARMAGSENVAKNQRELQKFVLRMCREHPYHSLYQVFCLGPSSPDAMEEDPPSGVGRRHSARHVSTPPTTQTQTERSRAATKIFNFLKSQDEDRDTITQVEFVCKASLEWAKFALKALMEQDRKRTRKEDRTIKWVRGSGPDEVHRIPQEFSIRKLPTHAPDVPIATKSLPVDPTMKYADAPRVQEFKDTFQVAGGLSVPKICVAVGTDGVPYKQLYKGEGADDLRQDAVMEQVFELVNMLLQRDRQTARRYLKVRGYKVVPLSSQAGVIEFVADTSQLKDWLQTAHGRYNPSDLKFSEVAKQLRETRLAYPNMPNKLVEKFVALRKRFRPVMRHYFTEKHKTPMSWFAMRLTYTRSVATTSIVGHVLGLGDRHVSNILLDNRSGEVVHIDLGVAFDQGKLLPIPELVPFRMTADMVDGMGTSGTAGVFQRCAEETLRVLRDESEVILTVLEVFRHDPLHSWTVSDFKARQEDEAVPVTPIAVKPGEVGIDMDSTTADEAADRALNSVGRKLETTLSVESAVNELISEATDVENLACIFVGWSPHL